MTFEQDYDITETECDECEEGMLWVNSQELVCDNCLLVSGADEEGTKQPQYNTHDEFYSNREKHRYPNSGRVIMPGGFSEAYPYVEGEEGYDNPNHVSRPYV